MTVEINKQSIEVAQGCATLAELLKTRELDGPGRAVAVDNCVVPRNLWGETPLAEGMKITVIRAVCGG